MSIELTVKHHFSAGHRIPGLAGPGAKCANLHGHTFGIEWTFAVNNLAADTFEFAAAKKLLRGWVDEHLDHGFLYASDDVLVADTLADNGWKCFHVDPVPSTEAIAALLMRVATGFKDIHAPCVRVTVTEGPHNAATVTL